MELPEHIKQKIAILVEYEAISLSEERRFQEFGETCYSLAQQEIKERDEEINQLKNSVALLGGLNDSALKEIERLKGLLQRLVQDNVYHAGKLWEHSAEEINALIQEGWDEYRNKNNL